MTHRWRRNYDPRDLLKAMDDLFEPHHARTALASLIGVFEAAAKGFVRGLKECGRLETSEPRGYRNRLKWVFQVAMMEDTCAPKTLQRIPNWCLDIDHARRIRNLWMHHNGLFAESYRNSCIPIPGRQPIIDKEFERYERGTQEVPVILAPEAFLRMSRSHLDVLHIVHNTLQRLHFGHAEPHSYRDVEKGIEWHRLLVGK